MLTVSPTIGRARTSVHVMARRFKKNPPRLTRIFYLIMYHANELDDSHMYLNKIYTSYVFLFKAKIEHTISTTDSQAIKKLVIVGGIFS